MTVTGPGGVGKTRLAVQVAAGLEAQRGVVFADLTEVVEPDLVPFALARSLGLPDLDSRPALDAIAGAIRSRPLLVVLDNVERVTGASPFIGGLLEACPLLRILATSRAPLRLRAEREYPLPPLVAPDPARATDLEALFEFPAVALFVERSRVVHPDFALTAENAADIVKICRLLDGLPLAIELAAAKGRLLTPRSLAGRLELGFGLLRGGASDSPIRHQSLRDTIAWSYDLLNEAEKSLFRRIALFPGGCSPAAIEAVRAPSPGAGIEALEALVLQSLVQADLTDGEEPRYRMLAAIRDFGLEQLSLAGEDAGVRRLQLDFLAGLVEEEDIRLRGPDQLRALKRLDREQDNLRAALAWCGETGNGELMLRLVGSLGWYWYLRGHIGEGWSWCTRALAEMSGDGRGRALVSAGLLANRRGNRAEARRLFEESIGVSRRVSDVPALTDALCFLSLVTDVEMDTGPAVLAANEAVQLVETLDDPWRRAHAYLRAEFAASPVASGSETGEYLTRSLALARATGDRVLFGAVLNRRGERARIAGDFDLAGRLYQESIGVSRELGNAINEAIAIHNLGYIALEQGRWPEALAKFSSSYQIHRNMGVLTGIAYCLIGFSATAAVAGDANLAALLAGAAAAYCEPLGFRVEEVDRRASERFLQTARDALGAAAYAREESRGRDLDPETCFDEVIRRVGDRARAGQPGIAGQTGRKGFVEERRPPRSPAAGEAGLTARESEVVVLLARGLSNQEIAERLVVSTFTVRAHLRSIYGKLGVSSRTSAVRWATDHGLL